jgi:hypothetical protein
MEHLRFKADQTAAIYIARGLDEKSQEAFELHLMTCGECVNDVEAWRAIEQHMPRSPRAAGPAAPAAILDRGLKDWRLVASLISIGVLGAIGGWYGRSFDESIDPRTAFFNAQPVTRGADECTPLKFGADTSRVVLRVSGVGRDRKVLALDPQGRELASEGYAAWRQADGSWLLQFAAAQLSRRAIRLESRGAGSGPGEPLGCISADVTSPP